MNMDATVHVVSFDVGKHNMALCAAAVTAEDVVVEHWEVVDVDAPTMRETCMKVMGLVQDRPWITEGHRHVVVEQQTQTNAPMRVLQHVLQVIVEQIRRCTGVNEAPPVVLIPARSKYEMVGGAVKGSYATNKRNSVQFARQCDGLTAEQRAMFEAHKKRDDLSDSLMQGVWYARRRILAKAVAAAEKAAKMAQRAQERAAKAEARAASRAAGRKRQKKSTTDDGVATNDL